MIRCPRTLLAAAVLPLALTSTASASRRPEPEFHTRLAVEGPSIRSLTINAVAANGGMTGWRWVRRLEFRQRFQVHDAEGHLQGHGQLLKRLAKAGGSFFERAEDAAVSAPPLVRALGPEGVFVLRGARPVDDPVLEAAWVREAYRDFLALSLPHVLEWSQVRKTYRGVVPVRGVPCHQILVTSLPGWRPFEGREFLVSLACDDLRVLALEDWAADRPDRIHRAWFGNHTTATDGTVGHTWRYPRRWEYLDEDGDTVTLLLDALTVNPRMDDAIFRPSPDREAGAVTQGPRETAPVPGDRMPGDHPRRTFFVRTPSWSYYMQGKHRQTLE